MAQMMTLKAPFSISSRLMAALEVGGATLSMAYGPTTHDGRIAWQCFIDLPDGSEHEVADLRSGCGGGSLQEAFCALLSFLTAAAESKAYHDRTGRPGENEDLFPAPIVDWAAQYSDELQMLSCELEETPNLISE